MVCLCPDYVIELARKHEAERRAEGIVDTCVVVRRGRLVLALQPEQLGPDDTVIPDDDPYYGKKTGRPRAFVEVWGVRSGDEVVPPGAEDLG